MKVAVFVAAEIKPDLVSSGIMFFTGADYSHIGLMIYNENAPPMIWHSVGEGVCAADVSEYEKTHKLTISEQFELSEQAFGFIRALKGMEYSDSQYIGFIFPFLRKYVQNKRTKFICSEFVTEVLEEFTDFRIEGDSDFLTPRQVWEAVQQWLQNRAVKSGSV